MKCPVEAATTAVKPAYVTRRRKEPMRTYAIAIEYRENNLPAYVPDLPGCITTGKTVEEIELNIQEAIDLHLEGMREDEITACH
jgi:predicted RNase H-like HicB family nuclease